MQKPYYENEHGKLYCGDCLEILRQMPEQSVNCCVTSPPYWGLRDYGVDGQLGQEETPEQYVQKMVDVFREVRRVLRDDGTLWLNLGDSYANDTKWGGTTGGKHAKGLHGTNFIGRNRTNTGLNSKNLVGIPWRVAFAMQSDGWYLRQDIIWSKPNPMPESVHDRCTKSHEYIFLLSKQERYYYDAEAIREFAVCGSDLGLLRGRQTDESGKVAWCAESIKQRQNDGVDSRMAGNGLRNKRDVWTVATQPFSEAHFATFPPALIEPCILAGCLKGGIVLDPFFGSGTTGYVCQKNYRKWTGFELNPEYCGIAAKRMDGTIKQIEGQVTLFDSLNA